MTRFYVQDPHLHGLAVLDREKGALIVSSFGDTDDAARGALETVARALNSAVEDPCDTDAFKDVYPSLYWRVVEYLAYLYQDAEQRVTETDGHRGGYVKDSRVWPATGD